MTLLKRIQQLEQTLVYDEADPVFFTVKPPIGYTQPYEPRGVHLIWDKTLRLDRLPNESLDELTERAKRELVEVHCSKSKPSILFFEYPDISPDELAQYDIGVTIGQPRL